MLEFNKNEGMDLGIWHQKMVGGLAYDSDLRDKQQMREIGNYIQQSINDGWLIRLDMVRLTILYSLMAIMK